MPPAGAGAKKCGFNGGWAWEETVGCVEYPAASDAGASDRTHPFPLHSPFPIFQDFCLKQALFDGVFSFAKFPCVTFLNKSFFSFFHCKLVFT